jgi:hypothetical protein
MFTGLEGIPFATTFAKIDLLNLKAKLIANAILQSRGDDAQVRNASTGTPPVDNEKKTTK